MDHLKTLNEMLNESIEQKDKIQANILSALGGHGKLVSMIGAKDFVYSKKGLTFKLGRVAKKINMITIELNGKDTYDITLANFSIKNGYVEIHKDEDVQAEYLKTIIEMKTGLKLSI